MTGSSELDILQSDALQSDALQSDASPSNAPQSDALSSTATMSASGSLLHRPIPAHALHERTAQLAAPLPHTGQLDACSVLVFRLGQEWFALSAGLCRQVIAPVTPHTLPHRSNSTLLGVVNVRGQMLLKVSLLDVLGLSCAVYNKDIYNEDSREEARPGNSSGNSSGNSLGSSLAAKVYPRMVVIEKALPAGGTDVWVFDVDELDGIHLIDRSALESPSAGVQASSQACTQRVFLWHNRRVSLLDDTRLFDALRLRAL